jgi:peptidoglycan/xylan/chitin deacetylase (PgdA/CDA1 family)
MMLFPRKTPRFVDALFPHYCWRKPNQSQEIYLTFDDGPHPDITPWVLDLLDTFDAKATFFCVGENVERYPELYAELLKRGHQTGNHTQHHLNGWKNPAEAYVKDVLSCAQHVDSKLFRPPYGKLTRAQSRALNNNFTIVMWSMLSGDFNPRLNLTKALQKLNKGAEAGQIVVFHDSLKAAPQLRALLPPYLAYLRMQNYTLACL